MCDFDVRCAIFDGARFGTALPLAYIINPNIAKSNIINQKGRLTMQPQSATVFTSNAVPPTLPPSAAIALMTHVGMRWHCSTLLPSNRDCRITPLYLRHQMIIRPQAPPTTPSAPQRSSAGIAFFYRSANGPAASYNFRISPAMHSWLSGITRGAGKLYVRIVKARDCIFSALPGMTPIPAPLLVSRLEDLGDDGRRRLPS